jgi:hypothetical protein
MGLRVGKTHPLQKAQRVGHPATRFVGDAGEIKSLGGPPIALIEGHPPIPQRRLSYPRCDLLLEWPPEEWPPPWDLGALGALNFGAEKCFGLEKCCDEPRCEEPY